MSRDLKRQINFSWLILILSFITMLFYAIPNTFLLFSNYISRIINNRGISMEMMRFSYLM